MIDAHAHLTDRRYGNVSSVVDEYTSVGVKTVVDAGYDKPSSEGAQENANRFDSVFFTCGYHPSEAGKNNDLSIFDRMLSDKKCLAVGEIGLDYHYEGYCVAEQKKLFLLQMEIACDAHLPIVVHSRDASKDTLDMLTENKRLIKNGFLMHCYSESAEQAKRYADLGGYFSFGGVITFKNAKKDDIVRSIPCDRLLTETDSPYLAPEPKRGSLNSPALITHVYEKMSQIIEKEVEELKRIVRENFLTLFGKNGYFDKKMFGGRR